MAAYRTQQVENLARQLQRGPSRLCLRHLLNIEFALTVLKAEKHYPADFVWHAVTGVPAAVHHPAAAEPVLVRGSDLRHDLAHLAESLSSSVRIPGTAFPQPLFAAAELAQRFDVSLKTVTRWRQRGLTAWKVSGEDGHKRVLFPECSVRRFVAENPALVRRAARFSHLSEAEQTEILRRAEALASDSNASLNSVAERIAAETGRGRETIRLILKRQGKLPAQHAVVRRSTPSNDLQQRDLQIWEAYQDGATLPALAERFGKPAAEIYAVATRMRAYELRARTIEYMHSPAFTTRGAEAEILQDPAVEQPFAERAAARRAPADLPPYLRELFRLPLLSRAGEQALFRKMNYLKFRAETARRELDPETASARELDELDALLKQSEQIKNRITRANLRLVVHIAKRHASRTNDLFELISEGNVALLRAVDLFDFTRGYKFSTYASWAIMRQLARQTSAAQKQRSRYRTGLDEIYEAMPASIADSENALAARELLERMSTSLSRRQWFILRHRFGLDRGVDPQTLAQLGERLGVSKERVRQIESQAIARLQRRFGEQFGRL